MSAGLARIIEICFVAPPKSQETPPSIDDDSNSDHTLADPLTPVASFHTTKKDLPSSNAVQAWKHLPPFVSTVFMFCRLCH